MDYELLWSSSQVNQYLFKQLRDLCKKHGFKVSPKHRKKLVRVKEHYIEIIFPEVIYMDTWFHMQVASTSSFAQYYYFDKRIIPCVANDKNLPYNFYSKLAVEDKTTSKLYYSPKKIETAWNEAISIQVQENIIDYFNNLNFPKPVELSKKEAGDGILTYCPSPGTNDALFYLTIAYNEIWLGNISASIPLLEKAAQGYEKSLGQSNKMATESTFGKQENYNAIIKLLSIIQNGGKDMEKEVLHEMQTLEDAALDFAWGFH